MESEGFSISGTVSFAYNSMAAQCPGNPCEDKIRNKMGNKMKDMFKTSNDKRAAARKAYDEYETPDYERRTNDSALERNYGEQSFEYLNALERGDVGELERGDLGDGVQAFEQDFEQDFELVTRARTRVLKRFGGSAARPHKLVSEFLGWETVREPVGVPSDSLERERITSGKGSAGFGVDKSSSSQSSFESASESKGITTLGASPRGDVMEWAQQTVNENMPISYQLKSVCGLVKMALERDFPGDLDRGEYVKAPTAKKDFMSINVTDDLKKKVMHACMWAQCMLARAQTCWTNQCGGRILCSSLTALGARAWRRRRPLLHVPQGKLRPCLCSNPLPHLLDPSPVPRHALSTPS